MNLRRNYTLLFYLPPFFVISTSIALVCRSSCLSSVLCTPLWFMSRFCRYPTRDARCVLCINSPFLVAR